LIPEGVAVADREIPCRCSEADPCPVDAISPKITGAVINTRSTLYIIVALLSLF
jgi:hypothetical protein